jgi:hypothetical protein
MEAVGFMEAVQGEDGNHRPLLRGMFASPQPEHSVFEM